MPDILYHYLVIDTNVFVRHLSEVQDLHKRLVTHSTASWLLVPTQVITELDGLKNNPTVRDDARFATAWLLETARAQRHGRQGRIKLQRWSERAISPNAPTANLQGKDRPDDAILSCCLYFANPQLALRLGTTDDIAQEDLPPPAAVTLWTDDRNLSLAAEANGIPTHGGRVTLAALATAAGVPLDADENMDIEGDVEDDRDVFDFPLLDCEQRYHNYDDQSTNNYDDPSTRAYPLLVSTPPGPDGDLDMDRPMSSPPRLPALPDGYEFTKYPNLASAVSALRQASPERQQESARSIGNPRNPKRPATHGARRRSSEQIPEFQLPKPNTSLAFDIGQYTSLEEAIAARFQDVPRTARRPSLCSQQSTSLSGSPSPRKKNSRSGPSPPKSRRNSHAGRATSSSTPSGAPLSMKRGSWTSPTSPASPNSALALIDPIPRPSSIIDIAAHRATANHQVNTIPADVSRGVTRALRAVSSALAANNVGVGVHMPPDFDNELGPDTAMHTDSDTTWASRSASFASCVTKQLESLFAMIPDGAGVQFVRAVSRGTSATRTLQLFFARDAAGRQIGRKVRSGEAADAVLVLFDSLREIGVPGLVSEDCQRWEEVSGSVRALL